jgi:hypothetical protein
MKSVKAAVRPTAVPEKRRIQSEITNLVEAIASGEVAWVVPVARLAPRVRWNVAYRSPPDSQIDVALLIIPSAYERCYSDLACSISLATCEEGATGSTNTIWRGLRYIRSGPWSSLPRFTRTLLVSLVCESTPVLI